MLIRFAVSNFRSIATEAELSMVAIDRDRDEARQVESLGESLLTVSAIYGANAAGKSNVVAALAWLCEAVTSSLRFWEDGIPVEPFTFGTARVDSEFVVELAIDGVRFEYIVTLNSQRITYEALFHYPEKKRRRIFERDEDGLKIRRGLGAISGARSLLTDTTLVLSAARRFGAPLVSDFARDLLRTQFFGIRLRRPALLGEPIRDHPVDLHAWRHSTMQCFQLGADRPALMEPEPSAQISPPDRERALAMLRLADLGIEDVLIDEQELTIGDAGATMRRRRLRLLHKSGNQREPLAFDAESEGTKSWFRLIGPVLAALREGSLVVFDELDASLHPTLTAQLLQIFGDRATNPFGAQLVFTSHDTSLLNHLNRDEVWLVEKNGDGSTRLGALADFAGERVRKSQNLENAYLHGRFGALPRIDQVDLLRALGLIG